MPKIELPLLVMTHPIDRSLFQTILDPWVRKIIVKNRSDLRRALKKADGLITLLSNPVDRELLSAAPHLKVVGNYAVGVNNIDLKTCAEFGIQVVNTPGVLTRSTAELAVALLFACARRLPEGEALSRSGRFKGWLPDLLLGMDLCGREATIVGRGKIGTETEVIFKALGLNVHVITRHTSKIDILHRLKRTQILSLHLPLTEQTRHWLNQARLAALPPDAIVINTSRGPVIDEKALIDTLRHRRIFAAGLDVYENEPSIPSTLRKLKNVVLLPHLGSATVKTRQAMARLLVQGVLAVLDGKAPANTVTFSP